MGTDYNNNLSSLIDFNMLTCAIEGVNCYRNLKLILTDNLPSALMMIPAERCLGQGEMKGAPLRSKVPGRTKQDVIF